MNSNFKEFITLNSRKQQNIFWNFVNEIDWYNLAKESKNDAIDTMTNYLLDNYTVDEIIELQREAVNKRTVMEDMINSYINKLKEEDKEKYALYKLDNMETIDLASHIVGLGKTMYNYVMDNPYMALVFQDEYIPCFEDAFDKAVYALNQAN